MKPPRNQQEAHARMFADAYEAVVATKGEGITASKIYDVAVPGPEVGTWYFVYPCGACGRDTPLFEDRTGGRGITPITNQTVARLRSECVHCGADVEAPLLQVHSAEWKGNEGLHVLRRPPKA